MNADEVWLVVPDLLNRTCTQFTDKSKKLFFGILFIDRE